MGQKITTNLIAAIAQLSAAGPWDADYGRVYKNDDGDEAICCGFSRGAQGSHIMLRLKSNPMIRFEVKFVWVHRHDIGNGLECKPHEAEADWFAVELMELEVNGTTERLNAPFCI
jgi:hypothetical protein